MKKHVINLFNRFFSFKKLVFFPSPKPTENEEANCLYSIINHDLKIFSKFCDNFGINTQIQNYPLIILCAQRNALSLVNYLFSRGGEIDPYCRMGTNMLFESMAHQDGKLFNYLLEKGLAIKSFHLTTSVGNPILRAIEQKYIDRAQKIIRMAPNYIIEDGKHKESIELIWKACKKDYIIECGTLLIEKGYISEQPINQNDDFFNACKKAIESKNLFYSLQQNLDNEKKLTVKQLKL